MKVLKTEKKLCVICMEVHEVQTLIHTDTEVFKGEKVSFDAIYEYCANGDEYLETEEMMKANGLAIKDAYRVKMNLLTSKEIIAIRNKYGVSQKDFAEILDWEIGTFIRYENHQVQDRTHDDVLRKIDADPKWFLDMLKGAKGKISNDAYNKYYQLVSDQY